MTESAVAPRGHPTPGRMVVLFDLDDTFVDGVYQDPVDLLKHLDEFGVRAAE